MISFLRTFYEQEKSLNNLSQKDSLYHEILAKIAEVSITHREIEIIKHDKLAKAIREFLKSLKKSVIPHESSSALLYSLAELQSKEITKEEIAWILKQAITHLAYTTEFPAFTRKFISFIITHCGIDDPKTNECMNHLFTLRSACPIDAILVYVEALTRVYL